MKSQQIAGKKIQMPSEIKLLARTKRGTFICAHAWIFFQTLHIDNSLYTNYENVFIELDS